MSESEKLRREEFQKNRKQIIRIFLAVILGLSILTVTFFGIFIAMDANTYVYFKESGNVIYHAYLNDNEYYEEERLNGGHAYVSSLIQKMDAAFTYRVEMDTDDVTFRYQYRVDAQLMLLDRNSGAPIYNPVETILGPTISTFRGRTLTIDPIVNIDYIHYNEKAQSFIEKYKLTGVSAQLNVTMYVNIVGMSEKFAANNQGQYYLQVTIPLNQEVIKPQSTSTIPQGEQSVLSHPYAAKASFKAFASFFGALDLVALAILAYYILMTRDVHIDYERKVQKLLTSYRPFIQKITNPFDSNGYQILSLTTFQEMLEIRDTLQMPILMYENEDKTQSLFMIPTSTGLLYLFEIKVDTYDEIYGEEETEEEIVEEIVEEIEEIEEEIMEEEEIFEETEVAEEPTTADEKKKKKSNKSKKNKKRKKFRGNSQKNKKNKHSKKSKKNQENKKAI